MQLIRQSSIALLCSPRVSHRDRLGRKSKTQWGARLAKQHTVSTCRNLGSTWSSSLSPEWLFEEDFLHALDLAAASGKSKFMQICDTCSRELNGLRRRKQTGPELSDANAVVKEDYLNGLVCNTLNKMSLTWTEEILEPWRQLSSHRRSHQIPATINTRCKV